MLTWNSTPTWVRVGKADFDPTILPTKLTSQVGFLINFHVVFIHVNAGNVARIKFLKTKEGTAMVQMGEPVAVERCVQHLNNIPIGPTGKLQIA